MAVARLTAIAVACGNVGEGGGSDVSPGTVVITVAENRQIPPPFGTLTVAVTEDGRTVVLTSENCEAVERNGHGP